MIAERDMGKRWATPLSNVLKRAFKEIVSQNSSFEEIIRDFEKNYSDKSIDTIRYDIDTYLNLEAAVFKEVEKNIEMNVLDVIIEREIAAIDKSPFKPEFSIILFGFYHYFLDKWLKHFELNKEDSKTVC